MAVLLTVIILNKVVKWCKIGAQNLRRFEFKSRFDSCFYYIFFILIKERGIKMKYDMQKMWQENKPPQKSSN